MNEALSWRDIDEWWTHSEVRAAVQALLIDLPTLSDEELHVVARSHKLPSKIADTAVHELVRRRVLELEPCRPSRRAAHVSVVDSEEEPEPSTLRSSR